MRHIGGYTGHAWQGDKYQSGRDIKEVAELVRADIRVAIHKGELPHGTYSVTIDRYAGGCSCNIRIKEYPEPFLIPEEVRARADRSHIPEQSKYTLRAAITLAKLEGILNAYRYDDSDSMIDYFSTNFYGRAYFDPAFEYAEERRILSRNRP